MTPIKLETNMLKAFDGTVINWKTINLITGYKKKLEKFMHQSYSLQSGNKTIFNLMHLEDSQELPDQARDLLPSIRQNFITFSEPFLNYLQTVKSGLIVLIEEDCQKRDRPDSTLLKWAHIGLGEEHALFADKIISYRSLCTFCVDVLYFLEDLMYSCPKATQSYERELEHLRIIRNHVDELLKNDTISLSDSQHKRLMHEVVSQHASTPATYTSVAEIYRNCINTYA